MMRLGQTIAGIMLVAMASASPVLSQDVLLEGTATNFGSSQADETPDGFAFLTITGAEPDSVVIATPQLTVSGIDTAVAAAVTGAGSPAFRINGGGLVTSGTVSNGDTVELSLRTDAGEYEKNHTARLTIGTEFADFSVTTRAADSIASAFTFTDVTGADVGATITATPQITVSGIEIPVTASVSGTGTPSFKVNGGALVTSAQVQNGDVLTLSLNTTAGAYATSYSATLSLGSVSDSFDVTTRPADVAPDAFSFTDATNVYPGAVATSNAVTLSGFEAGVSAALTGDAGAEYSLDNGLSWKAIGVSSTAYPGDIVLVRVPTAASLSTSRRATLTLGGVSSDFNATTASSFTCGSDGLSTLALGQKTCADPTYYVGTLSSERLYAKVISGTYAYRTSTTSSGASSTSDGVSNTTALISSSVTEHEAARACRLLGNEWYLPSIGELHILTGNQAVGTLPEITTNESGVFWSSTEYTASGARMWDPTQTSTPLLWQVKTEPSKVMCFRRDATPTTDRMPSGFSFTPASVADADFSMMQGSNVLTLAGIDAVTPISLSKTGPGTACYSVNGGTCQTASSYVLNGQTVQVQITTSSGLSETTSASLTVGDASTSFSVTTASTTCVTKDLTTLALGASSCSVINGSERATIYAGTLSGTRLYVTPMTGTYMWKNAFTSTTGTTSTTDGKTNTTSMTSTAALRTAHPAAAACWALGTDWYLPSTGELGVVRTNKATGKLTEINPGAPDAFWTSTQATTMNAYIGYWSIASNAQLGKPELMPIFCMRK